MTGDSPATFYRPLVLNREFPTQPQLTICIEEFAIHIKFRYGETGKKFHGGFGQLKFENCRPFTRITEKIQTKFVKKLSIIV